MDANIIDFFYLVDEFCKEFDKAAEGLILKKDCSKKFRKRAFRMSDSKLATIMIYPEQFGNLRSNRTQVKTLILWTFKNNFKKNNP